MLHPKGYPLTASIPGGPPRVSPRGPGEGGAWGRDSGGLRTECFVRWLLLSAKVLWERGVVARSPPCQPAASVGSAWGGWSSWWGVTPPEDEAFPSPKHPWGSPDCRSSSVYRCGWVIPFSPKCTGTYRPWWLLLNLPGSRVRREAALRRLWGFMVV